MEKPQSLRSLFTSAKNDKDVLGSRGDTNTDSYKDDVQATIAKFQECQRQIGILSLFSSNESLDDVSTGDLPYGHYMRKWGVIVVANPFVARYMTLEYHLAELMQRAHGSDRESVLRRAAEQYEKFLMRLDEYGLLSGGDKKLWEQYMASPSSFTLAPANDAAARREVKVTRFREEKELKQKLEVCCDCPHKTTLFIYADTQSKSTLLAMRLGCKVTTKTPDDFTWQSSNSIHTRPSNRSISCYRN